MSATILGLYVVGVVLALLTLYTLHYLEYVFASLQVALAIFILFTHCLNQTVIFDQELSI